MDKDVEMYLKILEIFSISPSTLPKADIELLNKLKREYKERIECHYFNKSLGRNAVDESQGWR